MSSKNTDYFKEKILNNNRQVLVNNDRSKTLPYETEEEKGKSETYLKDKRLWKTLMGKK